MLDFGFYNMDCMQGMKEFPDKYFDLAICDPPYGIDKKSFSMSRLQKYGQMKTVNEYRPDKAWFEELQRVSKNQIVFGYNHLCDILPPTKEFIFWYKHQPVDTFSDGELAYTSFEKTAKCFDYAFYGSIGREADRIHPTQKPVALYEWILGNYARGGYKILDTHVGSASSLIACHKRHLDYVGFELDAEYYRKASERLEGYKSQLDIYDVFGFNPYQE